MSAFTKQQKALYAEIREFKERMDRIELELRTMVVTSHNADAAMAKTREFLLARADHIELELRTMVVTSHNADAAMAKTREFLLARADHIEAKYGRREEETTRLWRRRANSEAYCAVLTVYMQSKALMREADEAYALTPAEKKAVDDRHMAEAVALRNAIDAMLRRGVQ